MSCCCCCCCCWRWSRSGRERIRTSFYTVNTCSSLRHFHGHQNIHRSRALMLIIIVRQNFMLVSYWREERTRERGEGRRKREKKLDTVLVFCKHIVCLLVLSHGTCRKKTGFEGKKRKRKKRKSTCGEKTGNKNSETLQSRCLFLERIKSVTEGWMFRTDS